MFKYSINLAWSDEDDCYVATIPEFPYLSAFGDTQEEAMQEARTAAEGIIAVMREDGEPVPEPKKAKCYSGQLRLRLPKTMHAALAKESESEGVSLNTYILSRVAFGLGGTEAFSAIMHQFKETLCQYTDLHTETLWANATSLVEKLSFGQPHVAALGYAEDPVPVVTGSPYYVHPRAIDLNR